MELELIPLIGIGRYPANNDFLDKYRNRREDRFVPKIPLGYDRTRIIEIENGINRKIPALQTTFKFWVQNEEKKYLSTGLSKLDIGKMSHINDIHNRRP